MGYFRRSRLRDEAIALDERLYALTRGASAGMTIRLLVLHDRNRWRIRRRTLGMHPPLYPEGTDVFALVQRERADYLRQRQDRATVDAVQAAQHGGALVGPGTAPDRHPPFAADRPHSGLSRA